MPTAALATTGSVLTATEYNYLPRGLVASATNSGSNQASVTTEVDLTSLSLTFTFTSGRNYLITAQTHVLSSISDDIATLILNTGSNVNTIYSSKLSTLEVFSLTMSFMTASLSGSTTVKLRGSRSTGTGNLTYFHSRNSFLRIYDMGVA